MKQLQEIMLVQNYLLLITWGCVHELPVSSKHFCLLSHLSLGFSLRTHSEISGV